MSGRKSIWRILIPWINTAASIAVLMVLANFLMENINWFKSTCLEGEAYANLDYRIYCYNIHMSMIKRSIGLFTGFAMIFLGLAVVFYTLRKNIEIGVRSENLTGYLATASPGLFTMVLGVILIAFVTRSESSFPPHNFEKNQTPQNEKKIQVPKY